MYKRGRKVMHMNRGFMNGYIEAVTTAENIAALGGKINFDRTVRKWKRHQMWLGIRRELRFWWWVARNLVVIVIFFWILLHFHSIIDFMLSFGI